MNKSLGKRILICSTFLLIINQVVASPYLVPVNAEEFFHYEPTGWKRYFIDEVKDISQACFFSLEGLRMIPVNVFVQYFYSFDGYVRLGVTATPGDKETVITYYYPKDEDGKTIWPLENDLIESLYNRVYRHDDEGHQARHHTKRNPLSMHTHRVFYHPAHVISLYKKHSAELAAKNYGICHETPDLPRGSYYEWYVLNKSAINQKLSPGNAGTFSIDSILNKSLDIPGLISTSTKSSLHKGILRAAVIFNGFPEIQCVYIDDVKYSRGSEDMENHLGRDDCVKLYRDFRRDFRTSTK